MNTPSPPDLSTGQTHRAGASSLRIPIYLALFALLLVTIFIRIRLLEVPLERDEGEYAYMGQILLDGTLPYSEAYNMKFPGVYFLYGLILFLFGETVSGIHLALLAVNLASAFLLFAVGRRLSGSLAGAFAGAAYLVMTLSPAVHGFWANTEHFVVLFMLAALLALLRALEKGRGSLFLASGLLFGLAFLMKQHGAVFAAFGALYAAWFLSRPSPPPPGDRTRALAAFLAGAALPFGAACLVFALAGTFDTFWFWTFSYSSKYAGLLPLDVGLENFTRSFLPVALVNLPLLAVALYGLFSLGSGRGRCARRGFVALFFLFSLASTIPGLYFRPHYFLLLLPSLALLFAVGAAGGVESRTPGRAGPALFALLMVITLLYPLLSQRAFLFTATPVEASRLTYGLNPFPESVAVARYLEKNTGEGDRIAVLGSEPQIFFYSGRRSATGHIYMYGLMEPHPYALKMQQECMEQIEAARPQFLVVVNVPSSWLIRPASEKAIVEWIPGYVRRNYRRVGVVDLLPGSPARYRWDSESEGHRPHRYNIQVFRRADREGGEGGSGKSAAPSAVPSLKSLLTPEHLEFSARDGIQLGLTKVRGTRYDHDRSVNTFSRLRQTGGGSTGGGAGRRRPHPPRRHGRTLRPEPHHRTGDRQGR